MNAEVTKQFEHSWRIFADIVQSFAEDAWLHAGRGSGTPARLSLHILQGTKYYLQDRSSLSFASGKPFDISPETADGDQLPSQEDVLEMIGEFDARLGQWLRDQDLMAANSQFPWAGQTQLGVALFLLRHITYHLGELSSLLNESCDGKTEDHWVGAL
jgi:hypothetical protein